MYPVASTPDSINLIRHSGYSRNPCCSRARLDSSFRRNDEHANANLRARPRRRPGFCSEDENDDEDDSKLQRIHTFLPSQLRRRMQAPTQLTNQGFRGSITKDAVFRPLLRADAPKE